MGKSPAKWIKSVLFGKKSSRSHASKGRGASKAVDHKECVGGKGTPDYTVNSPVISQPLPVNAARNDSEAEKAVLSLTTDGAVFPSKNEGTTNQGAVASAASSTAEKIKEEQAATKAQAAFRGYLARRAFRALQGIIRLQALISGHLVRRQAIATLHCMQGIVKLQSLVRGRKVRTGSEVYSTPSNGKLLDAKQSISFNADISSQKIMSSSNAFVCKLLSSKTTVLSLQMQYVQREPNSVHNWLERWTCSQFWKPPPQPKVTVDLKTQARSGGYAMETESGRPKRIVRRNVSANTDSGSTNNTTKRNFKKINSSHTEHVQEHPQSELEKVKRNLRRISNSVSQSSDQAEIEAEKPKYSFKRPSSMAPDVPEVEMVDSAEKTKKNNFVVGSDCKAELVSYQKHDSVAMLCAEMASEPALETGLHVGFVQEPSFETTPDTEAATKQADGDAEFNASISNNLVVELRQLNGFVKDKDDALLNGENALNEEQASHENQRTNKRRASLSAKSDFQENGAQNTPTLPSYMAATESAKAKLRGQSSPRFSSEGIEKNGYTRRHSLPSLTGGKQRQTISGGGIRTDKSFSSSRDGHDRPIQVEWRR